MSLLSEKEVAEVHKFEVGDLECKCVTVYADRAEVKRVLNVAAKKGANEVIVSKLPPTIDEESIRVDGHGQATICEVQFQKKQVSSEEEEKSKRKDLTQQIRALREKIELKGANEVIVSKLPPTIDEESIRVDGHGQATICEVQFQKKQVSSEEEEKSKRKDLTQQIRALREKIELNKQSLNRLKTQKVVWLGYAQQISGNPGKPLDVGQAAESTTKTMSALGHVSLDQMEEFLGRFGEKVSELDEKIVGVNREAVALGKELDVLEGSLRAIGGNSDDTYLSREVSILLEAKEDSEIVLDVSYMVSKASWTPSYDLRVFAEDKIIKLQYYGLIMQNSGEDWTETQLFLSTATPSVGGKVPNLPTLKVDWKEDVINYMQRAVKYQSKGGHRKGNLVGNFGNMLQTRSQPQALMSCTEEAYEIESDECSLESLRLETLETNVKESVISTNFEIPRQGSIPSDGVSHKVNVAVVDLKCQFEYITVPKKSPIAYLKARILNSSSYPFLKGPVSVFLDNSFVAKSDMRAVSPGEEFTCCLGPDLAMRIEYKPVHKYHQEVGLLSKSTVIAYVQKIEIKNTRKDKITLRILEQVPLSSFEKVKVSLLDPLIPAKEGKTKSPYKMNKDNNLEWDLVLSEGEHRTLTIKYSIEYPKGKEIQLRE